MSVVAERGVKSMLPCYDASTTPTTMTTTTIKSMTTTPTPTTTATTRHSFHFSGTSFIGQTFNVIYFKLVLMLKRF